jgi:lipopolysaccharide export system protein LptA
MMIKNHISLEGTSTTVVQVQNSDKFFKATATTLEYSISRKLYKRL